MGRDDLSEQRFLLLDGNSLINRAYYGLYGRQSLTAPDGTPTGALFAFFNMFMKWLEDLQPSHVVAAFDRREPTFRHKKYEDYKGTRKPMPDDLAVQIPILKELLEQWGICCMEQIGYEADDLIGTLSVLASAAMPVTIVSGDKDSFQLANERVTILQPVTRSGRTEVEQYDPQAIYDRYQLSPDQLIDMKALMGDPSDNIPGVRGIGEKTAIELIRTYGSLEKLYESLDKIRPAIADKLKENRQTAILSRELVTIEKNVPIDQNLDGYRIGQMDRKALSDSFARLGFRTLMDRLELQETAAMAADVSFTLASASDLKADLEKRSDWITLRLDWPGPLTWIDQNEQIRLIPVELCAECWSFLSESSHRFFVHDYKTWLRNNRLTAVLPLVHDVYIAAYLLDQSDKAPGLERLFQSLTGKTLSSGEPAADDQPLYQTTLLDPEKKATESALAEQKAAAETMAIRAIGEHQRTLLSDRPLKTLADDVEFPLSRILAEMEHKGFRLDRQVLEARSAEMEQRLDGLQKRIYDLSGRAFNINSPKQLSDILFQDLGLEPGKKRSGGTYATDAGELDRLHDEHPIIPLIVQYRQTAKLRATFVEGLIKVIDPADGRVHTTFNQTLTATGRLSSSEPNLQNIPIRTAEGRRIREAFVADSGCVLIDADYSQIELRLLAHLSGDPAMTEAFNHQADIHSDTACRLFGCSAGQVTSEQRSIAKTMNFSIVYGISDFGLARDLGVSVRKAHQLIAEYEAKYPQIRAFLKNLVTEAYEHGYVETLSGRRRYLTELKSPQYTVRQFGERAAMNTPIQGTAADLIKKAMVLADQALKDAGLSASLILQIHDELIVEAPEHEAQQAAELLRHSMESAMELSVPLVADVSFGYSWAACKENEADSLPAFLEE